MPFVLDCSVAMSWAFPDQWSPATLAIRSRLDTDAAAVPTHWFLEVANVLAWSERRARFTPAQSAEFIQFLSTLDLEVDEQAADHAFDHLLPLSRAHRLSAYDAAYLDLALRRDLPLATLDADLRRAAERAGVATLGI